MKTMLNITLFVMALSGVMALESCGDDDKPKTEIEKLPPATQEGKNTFGCLVDGKAWVTRSSIDADAYYQEGRLSITASLKRNGIDQTIRISLSEPNLQEDEYSLTEYPDDFGRLRDMKINCEYVTSTEYTGKLTITHLDQTKFIIAGIFEFEAYSDACDKVVTVTHGRFDLHYAP